MKTSGPGRQSATRPYALAPLLLCAAVSLLFASAGAQSLPLEEKARFERSLEQKAEDVLFKLLGPGQAKVVVQTSMDFTRTEKLDVSAEATAGEDKNKFQWKDMNTEKQAVADYVMPGFPIFSAAGSESRSYQRQFIFPTSFIKRMSVTIILNKEVSERDAQNVRAVVNDILHLELARGDELVVVRAPFAPLWKTIWYTPEALSLVFKYGVLSLMGLIAMIVVAIGFLKLAGAMNTMAKAQQSHQITMDLGKGAPAAGQAPGGPAEIDPATQAEFPEAGEAGPFAGKGQEEIFFSVRVDQVPFLVQLIGREDPANVALVVSHLPPEVRTEFLRSLPEEAVTAVMANMARFRFVEPGIINTIKDELEKRLGGAEGGVNSVLGILSGMDLRSKRVMLENLGKTTPDVAAEVRKKIMLIEDLAALPDSDLSILVSSVKTEDWATAFHELPEELKARLAAQMAAKTRAMLEQAMKYGRPSTDKIYEVQEEIMGGALRLMREGRISNPLAGSSRLISGVKA